MKHSLFIGRYQPLHEGHIKLIRTVLDEGKTICVALRYTGISKKNPFTVEQRKKMFEKEFHDEMEKGRLKIIVIPDIEEVCYGRKVGWGIRKIKLDKQIEAISATKLRK